MSSILYLNLLVLYGVLCQGIIGTLSEKDIGESSELLVRQKRVINRAPGGDLREQIKNVPYIVSIRPYRIRHHCTGVILTQRIVLTVAMCVEMPNAGYYRVHSGTPRITTTGHYVSHNVTVHRKFVGNHPLRPADGIALISVSPPFTYSRNTQNIPIYVGPIHPGYIVTVSGWGCNSEEHPGTEHPDNLRSITVPIISQQECAILYGSRSVISDSDICTFDRTEQQYCGATDAGAPLVIMGNGVPHLVGIHLWNERVVGKSKPDVFVNLQNPRYNIWLAETIRTIEADLHFQDKSKHL